MSLIEGFGDEVVEVFALLTIVLLCLIAWRSTAIREFPQIRTVLILQRSIESTPHAVAETRNASEGTNDGGGSEQVNSDVNGEELAAAPKNDEPSNVQSSLSSNDLKEINAKRISYFAKDNEQPSCSTSNPTSSPGTSTGIGDSNVADEPTLASFDPDKSIRVKLKYLDDNQKVVEGNLEEMLGDFKRRYFEAELSDNKSVLLIFKGQVLSEERSLASLGLYDNCVVHCLVKAGQTRGAAQTAVRPPEEAQEWNLGAVLSSTISVMLLAAWLAQIGCPQFFTISTTSALVSLTALFAVSVVGIHFPQYLPSSS